jgi:hypothetical protein
VNRHGQRLLHIGAVVTASLDVAPALDAMDALSIRKP